MDCSGPSLLRLYVMGLRSHHKMNKRKKHVCHCLHSWPQKEMCPTRFTFTVMFLAQWSKSVISHCLSCNCQISCVWVLYVFSRHFTVLSCAHSTRTSWNPIHLWWRIKMYFIFIYRVKWFLLNLLFIVFTIAKIHSYILMAANRETSCSFRDLLALGNCWIWGEWTLNILFKKWN